MMQRFYIFISFFLIFFSTELFAQDNYNTLIFEGNKAFDKKNYSGAASKFLDATKLKPNDFTAHYNLGNSFYKRKMYAEAKAEFEKANQFAKNKNDKMAALYNLGNSYMQENQHEKAAEYYKQALKQNPYDDSSRKNYQIAMLKDKEQQQKKNGGKGGGGGKDGKDPQQQQDKDGKSQQQGGQGDQQQGKGSQGNQPDQNKTENHGSNMPKDQQDAILRRAEDKERETARKILNKNSYSMPQSNEKDW